MPFDPSRPFTVLNDEDLAASRSQFANEINDPAVAQQIYSLTENEVGAQGPAAHQAFIETLFNRASSRGRSLMQTATDRKYYPAVSFRPRPGANYQDALFSALLGSDVSGRATGNASGNVGFAGGPQTFAAGGERFGVEGPDIKQFDPSKPFKVLSEGKKEIGGAPAVIDPLQAKAAGEQAMAADVAARQAAQPSLLDRFMGLVKEPSPPWLQAPEQAARETLSGFVPKSAKDVGGLVAGAVAPFVQAGEDVAKTAQAARDFFQGKSLDEIQSERFPESKDLAEADKTPPFSLERYRAGFGILSQMGMGAGVARGIIKGPKIPEKPTQPRPETGPTGPELAPKAAPAAQPTAQPADVPQVINDLVPALRLGKEGPPDAVGQRGQTHADIIKEKPEVGAEITDETAQHGFALGDEFLSREEAAQLIGQEKPLTSQELRGLQARPVPVGPTTARFEPPQTTAEKTRFILDRAKVINAELGPLLEQQETMRAAGLRLDPGAEARIAELQAELAQPRIPEGGEASAVQEQGAAEMGAYPKREEGAGREQGRGRVGPSQQGQEVAGAEGQAVAAEPVRGTQADVEAARAAAGVSPYERELTRTWGQAAEEARKHDARYPGADQRLAQEVAKKPRPVTDREHVSLLRNWQKAELEHKAAVDAFNSAEAANKGAAGDRLAFTKNRLQEAFNALDKTGSAAGRGFNIRKMILREFYTPEAMEARFRAAKGGKALNEAEAKQVAKLVKDVQETSVARGKAQTQLEADARFAQRAQESVGKKANGAKTRNDVHDILKAESDAARARIVKERGKVEWTKEVEPCIL